MEWNGMEWNVVVLFQIISNPLPFAALIKAAAAAIHHHHFLVQIYFQIERMQPGAHSAHSAHSAQLSARAPRLI